VERGEPVGAPGADRRRIGLGDLAQAVDPAERGRLEDVERRIVRERRVERVPVAGVERGEDRRGGVRRYPRSPTATTRAEIASASFRGSTSNSVFPSPAAA
jgi:hypothetical protein